jgi:hypothetical protein
MTYQNIIVYLIIPLALFSTLSLLDNAQAQNNLSSSAKQSISTQQNQNMNITVQALMKTDIFEIKDTLEKAKLAIIEGNLKEALTGVRDVETQLLLIEPSPPTKFLSNIHKTITAIAKSNIDKSLDTLTNVQVTILKTENQIFKAAVANPQVMQQFTNMESKINEEEDSKDIEEEEDSKDVREQFNNMETIIKEEEYYTNIEDT